MPADTGALVLKALENAMAEVPVEGSNPGAEIVDVSAETPRVKLPRRIRRAGALTVIAESFIANGPAAMSRR